MTRPDFNWKLPREISDRLGTHSYGAQRAMLEQDHLLVVTHEPPSSESNARQHSIFLRRPGGNWQHNGVEQGERAFAHLIDQYESRLTSLEARYSNSQSADDMFEVMDELLPLARAATNLKDTVQSARDMVKEDKLLIDLRDRAVDISRGLELLLANARIALDYRLARHAEEQTRAAQITHSAQTKLNVIAALTFPLMTVAAVFGMNLSSGLENGPAWWFWAVFAGGILFGLFARGRVIPPPPAHTPAKPARNPAKAKRTGSALNQKQPGNAGRK